MPKANELFNSFRDWLDYLLERPVPLALVLSMGGLLIFYLVLARFEFRAMKGISKRVPLYIFLTVWALIAYFSFQLLVPAASYFYERLTLIVFVPTVAFIGMTLSEAFVFLHGRLRLILAIILPFALLSMLNDLPRPRIHIQEDIEGMSEVFELINDRGREKPTRIYATPNSHLVWAYYTGLPVQSIAPIRRSYLAEYSGRLIYLEENKLFNRPFSEDIESETPSSNLEREELSRLIQIHKVGRELGDRGFEQWVRFAPELPDGLDPVLQESIRKEKVAREAYRQLLEGNPIFRDLETDILLYFWMCFYFRFVDYPSRIHDQSNIYPLQQKSEIVILPEANTVAYIYDSE